MLDQIDVRWIRRPTNDLKITRIFYEPIHNDLVSGMVCINLLVQASLYENIVVMKWWTLPAVMFVYKKYVRLFHRNNGFNVAQESFVHTIITSPFAYIRSVLHLTVLSWLEISISALARERKRPENVIHQTRQFLFILLWSRCNVSWSIVFAFTEGSKILVLFFWLVCGTQSHTQKDKTALTRTQKGKLHLPFGRNMQKRKLLRYIVLVSCVITAGYLYHYRIFVLGEQQYAIAFASFWNDFIADGKQKDAFSLILHLYTTFAKYLQQFNSRQHAPFPRWAQSQWIISFLHF